MSYTLPIGPYHPALEEPYKIELDCEGEIVVDARIQIGFNFRAIEWLAERRNYTQNIALFERVCGICSNVHTLTYCMALENLAGIEVPRRAQFIRVIVAELERLHSHILWAGAAAHIMGFQTLFMTCFYLREKVMDILEAVSGNRVNYAMNCVGGVNRDIEDISAVLEMTKSIEETVKEQLIPIFTKDKTVLARCAGVGVLTRQDAIAWGALGPTARASGIAQDIRKDDPYAAYSELEFEAVVQTSGDVLARIVVRALEILESCRILRQALEKMPPGEWKGSPFVEIPAGEAVARIEAPRGEVFYYVASDGSDKPRRVKVRTPSFMNMPTVRLMMKNATLADAPLIQASIDPCYSCTDR
jgi:Ni,Fe-hydrogenase III large subunit